MTENARRTLQKEYAKELEDLMQKIQKAGFDLVLCGDTISGDTLFGETAARDNGKEIEVW